MSLNNAHEGYQYQDLLCSYFILKEVILGRFDSVLTFDKKHIENDRFDDLVIQNGDNTQRKQIKYSNETNAKYLSKDDLSNDNGASLAIYKLFENWRELRTVQTEFRLCLAWNDPIENNIKDALILQVGNSSSNSIITNVFKLNIDNIWQENPENFNRWNNLKRYVKQNNIDRNEFSQFCNEFLIETNFPKASLDFLYPNALERILIEQAKKIGIGEYPNNDISINDFLIKIVKYSGDFRTKSIKLSIKQILEKLRIKTDFGQIEQKFQINQEKNIIFKEKIEALLQDFRKNQKSILIAEPGAGKSWFLTNLIEYLKENNQKVVRHYCFTGIEDSFSEQRITSDVFFGNLIADIQLIYPESQKQKEKIFASNLNELNLLLSNINEPLVIIIDGLDHIERILSQSKTLSQEKTRIIDFISRIEIPDNVSIILGSQPVNEINTLIQNHYFLRVDLPKWNVDDILSLVHKFNIDTQTYNLTQILLDKSQGNPLYLNYMLNHLKENPNINIKNDFPEYDFNLKSYYDFLSSQLNENSTTLNILSCLEFSITREEFSEINPFSHHLDKDLKILSPVILENLSRGGISLYHDSFRRYQLEKLGEANISCYHIIGDWLNKKGFYDNPKSYRYLFKYLFNSGKYSEISSYATPDFLVKSLYYGYPEKSIRENSLCFLYVAQKLKSWSLLSFLSEFNRTIYSTNSEEYYNQFIENFEIYFESVLNIYGYDRANSLLFFNNEMNFDIVTTAKAFSILTKNGYKSDWKKVGDLFKDSISEENFEYFLYSQIDNKEKLLNILKKSSKNENEIFFNICISFLIKNNLLSVINSFTQELYDNVKNSICLKINKISILNNNDFYIPITFKSSGLFIDAIENRGYIDSKAMNDFYFLVSLYAKYDIDYLIEFEKSIKPQNFFYNWIKFFIRTFIIEQKFHNEELAPHITKNIEFLCSDVDPFKGNPRAVDFRYTNKRLIATSIVQSLKYIHNKDTWSFIIKKIIALPIERIDVIKEININDDNIDYILDAYSQFEENQESHYYEYAEYYFQKALIYSRTQYIEQAKNELKNAILYITNYTFRKDVTLSEIVDPIDALHKLNANLALGYTKKLKYLTDAVGKYTEDGKGIKWIAIDWFKHLSSIDYHLSGKYLISELMKAPYFWKLDYMFVDFLAVSQKMADPIILNFLYNLLPTNNREKYLNDFLNIINSIKVKSNHLAKLSLINLLNRDWNDSYEKLSAQTMDNFKSICHDFNLTFNIKKDRDNNNNYSNHYKKTIDLINQSLNISDNILNIEASSTYDIIEYYEKKEYILDSDLNLLYFYLMKCNDELVTINIISSLIKKKFPRNYEVYFENLFILIQRLNLSQDLKINLLTLNTLYSTDGWMNMCVYKEPLKLAVELDYHLAKNEIFRHLCEYFKLDSYRTLPIANLVTAFEFSGIEKGIIFDLYSNAYTYIESRLPDTNDFNWNSVESNQFLSGMSADELAITLMLAKMKNLDSTVQREVLFAIHYLINYKINLLTKPIKWFLENLREFNQLSVVAILELIYLEKDKTIPLITQCKADFTKCQKIGNFYINRLVDKII
ncbi:hypothetical protein [Gallibacterium anatis]|uniref:Nephrocystin 3-like N-terminal domain-containing protein n=1 Tax=Gallibacterium anatis TaxID=750 RepID=A0A1A7P583_9PAST|nr:hypothetical protein [Gallibacterium anatis]OBW91972.1 hypothetical protein QV02_10905 [Gallibacterium anatis]OBW96886.1 hypothetical protein QV03_10430 [Gallibacterium anatis]